MDIIPEELYVLLKETNKIEGVIGCMVAGAGGFDSFYCICKKDVNRQAILDCWSKGNCTISSVHISNKGLSIQLEN